MPGKACSRKVFKGRDRNEKFSIVKKEKEKKKEREEKWKVTFSWKLIAQSNWL